MKHQKPYWAEIRNDYFCTDFLPEEGAVIASVSIDAWKTRDENEEGKVIARVLLSEHGDILVDYHDNVARANAAAQESIQEAMQQLKAYWQKLQQKMLKPKPVLRDGVILTCVHETRFGVDHYVSLHPDTQKTDKYIGEVKKECDFGEYGDEENFDSAFTFITFNPDDFPIHRDEKEVVIFKEMPPEEETLDEKIRLAMEKAQHASVIGQSMPEPSKDQDR